MLLLPGRRGISCGEGAHTTELWLIIIIPPPSSSEFPSLDISITTTCKTKTEGERENIRRTNRSQIWHQFLIGSSIVWKWRRSVFCYLTNEFFYMDQLVLPRFLGKRAKNRFQLRLRGANNGKVLTVCEYYYIKGFCLVQKKEKSLALLIVQIIHYFASGSFPFGTNQKCWNWRENSATSSFWWLRT